MKRIKHRDLTHYFLREHSQLPRAYVASCERFFKSFKLHGHQEQGGRNGKYQASSDKLQAASLNLNTIK
jgi:hypothetical protein